MPVGPDRMQLFDRIVRLRRAERNNPTDRDVTAVRGALESDFGLVVTRSAAARILGLHHSSLQRWIDSGDLPQIIDPDGRRGVPLAAVVELYERLGGQGRSTDRRHRLEPTMLENGRAAAELRPDELVAAGSGAQSDPHQRANRRSLAYHRAVAKKLRRPMVDKARRQVWQWRDSGAMNDQYADAWEAVLNQSVAGVRKVISEDSVAAADLRQNSPFAGMLSEAERRRIFSEVR